MTSYLARAIWKLKPGSEFSIVDNDYNKINWIILDGEAPSIDKINEAIEQIKIEDAETEAVNNQKKKAAEAKLLALGLTLDEIKALGLA